LIGDRERIRLGEVIPLASGRQQRFRRACLVGWRRVGTEFVDLSVGERPVAPEHVHDAPIRGEEGLESGFHFYN
jgi:hypothetical protein